MAENLIGAKISLISISEVRYVGTLHNVNVDESTVCLQNVKVFGTEGRRKDGQQLAPNDRIFEYIVFKGPDIKDLEVCESPEREQDKGVFNDPAVVEASLAQEQPEPAQEKKFNKKPVRNAAPGQKSAPAPPPVQPKPKPTSFSEAVKGNAGVKPQIKSPPSNTRNESTTQANARSRRTSSTSNHNASAPNNKAIPGMGKHLLFRKFRGVTTEGKERLNDKVDNEFDMQAMNDKFSAIRLQSSHDIESSAGLVDTDEKIHLHSEEEPHQSSAPSYNKTSSFFDNITSDLKDRESGTNARLTRHEEKKLNTETFGAIALTNNTRFGYRGRGRGRGGYRGRGGRGRGGYQGQSSRGRGNHNAVSNNTES